MADLKGNHVLLRLGLPVAIICIWQAASWIVNNHFILPSPLSVLAVLANPWRDLLGSGTLMDNAIVSLTRVSIGFLIAVAFAVPLGIGMGRYNAINVLFDRTVSLLRPIPPLAWVPLSLAWLKIGIFSMMFIIAIGAFFPVLQNTMSGAKGVKKTWIEAVTMLGAKETDLLKRVILPAAAPSIWTGLRIGFGIAWMCVVAAEMLPGTNTGLGYLIMYAYSWGQVNVVMAGMVVIGLIGLVIDNLFKVVEVKKFGWRELER
jgi:NitT/TauT family transport system permease protein